MDAILGTFISAFQSGAANLQGKAMGLLFILMTIDFFLSVIKSLAQGGTNYFSLFLQKLFPYGAVIYMISHYAYLIGIVMEGFLQVGRIVGGANLSHSPEEIFGKGVQLFSDAINKISEDENLSFMNMIKGEAGGALFAAIATFLGYLGIFICFAIIALQMAICYLEFYLGAAFLIIFLPFLVFKPMAFLGEKAIGFVIGFGVKYMVLVAVAGVALKSIDGLVDQANADPSFMAILTVLGAAMLIAWLCWQAPALASGIMSGGPSLSGSSMAHAGLTAASMAIGAGTNLASKSIEKLESKSSNEEKASKTNSGNSSGGKPDHPNGSRDSSNHSSGGNILNSENAGSDSTNNSSSGESNSSEPNSSNRPSFSSGSILNGESGGSDGSGSNISSSPENSRSFSNSIRGSSNSSQENKASTASGTNSNNVSGNSAISFNPTRESSNPSQESKTSTASGTNSSVIGSQNTNSSTNSGSSNGILRNDGTVNNSSTSTEATKMPINEKIKNTGEKMQNVLNKANSLIPEEEHPQGGVQARTE